MHAHTHTYAHTHTHTHIHTHTHTHSTSSDLAFSKLMMSRSALRVLSSTTTSSRPQTGITRRSKSCEGGEHCGVATPSHPNPTLQADIQHRRVVPGLTFILSLPLSWKPAPWAKSFWVTTGLSPSLDTAMETADKTAFLMKPPVSSNRVESSSWEGKGGERRAGEGKRGEERDGRV